MIHKRSEYIISSIPVFLYSHCQIYFIFKDYMCLLYLNIYMVQLDRLTGKNFFT